MSQKRKNRFWLIVSGLLVVVFFLVFFQFQKNLQSAAQVTTKPFATFVSGVGFWFNEKIDLVFNIGEIKDKNDKLFNENLKLKSKLTKLKDVAQENEILRKELDLISESNLEAEASLIIGRDFSRDKQIVYLNKGSKNGIKEGMPIVVASNILVGQIEEVYPTTSSARLILDKSNRINAEIQSSQIKGIVRGEFGTSVVMDMIPQTAEIENNQAVTTSGLGNNFPRGLLIGYIKESEITVDKLFQRALLSLPVQFKNLRMVWVIKE